MYRDAKPDVRQAASEYISSITSTKEGCELIYEQKGHIALAKLLGDSVAISKNVITSLINMCDNSSVLTDLANDALVEKLMENLMEEKYPLVNLNLILLANLSTNDIGTGAILQMRQKKGSLKGLNLCRLVLWFIRTPVESSEADCYQYIATILNNITRIYEGRDLIMNENRKLIYKLVPYISSENPIRRTGIINMIRNIMLDDYYWDKLIDGWSEDGCLKEIVNRTCANLNGSHRIEKKTIDPMIYSLKKEREKDMNIISISLDLLLIITKYQKGREILREVNIYSVVRDMHMELSSILSDEIIDVIDSVVTNLMADELHPINTSRPRLDDVVEPEVEEPTNPENDYDDLPDLE